MSKEMEQLVDQLLERDLDIGKVLRTAVATGVLGTAALVGLSPKVKKPPIPQVPAVVSSEPEAIKKPQERPREEAILIDMKRIAEIESFNNPLAVNKRSGARGRYQIRKPTWEETVKRMGEDWSFEDAFDPEKSYKVANYYMHKRIPQMLRYYGVPDSVETRLAAYNWGVGHLERVYNKYREAWQEHLPKETRDYFVKYAR